MSSSTYTSVLAPLDKANLINCGLASPITPDGTQHVHKRRLNRSSDEENAHIPLVPFSAPDSTDAFSEIPADLISEATLNYLGYNKETAGRQHDTASDNDQEWYDCMNARGIATELQDAIMDPVFKTLRLTESCIFWILDTLEMRYRGLIAIQEASIERERALQRARSRPSRSGTGTGSNSTGQQSISSTQRLEPGIEQGTALSASALAAQNSPSYTTLFKGIDQAKINGM
jgi:hypothetical protein